MFFTFCMNVSLFLVSKNLCSLWEYLFLRKHGEQLWIHSSRNSLLKFLPQHKLWGEILFLTRVVSFKSTQKTLNLFLKNEWLQWHLIFQNHFSLVVKLFSNISLQKMSSQQGFEGKFYSDRRESFFKITQKTLKLKMSGFLFFMFSNRCSLETYQQNKQVMYITSRLRALGREFISFENTQRITNPSEASNNFFFCRKTSNFNGSCNVTFTFMMRH